MRQSIFYGMFTFAGVALNALFMAWAGYHSFNAAEVIMAAKLLEAVISLSIAPEGYAYGLQSARHHWANRWGKLLFWLTIGLFLRAGMLYVVASGLGLEHPNAVASGMLATDPAGVSLALGFSQPTYLQGMFWQLAIESQLNDAAGIAAYGIFVEHEGWHVGRILLETAGAGGLLAFFQTAIRLLVRRSNGAAKYELPAVMAAYLVFIALGISRHHSLILMSATASILADRLGEGIHLHDEIKEKIHHQWERVNFLGLGAILFLVAFMAPFASMHGRILFNGFVLMMSVGMSRAMVEYGKRIILHLWKGKPGDVYGYAAGAVNWLAGWTMLGVPVIIALLTGSDGDFTTGDSMYAAVVLSVFIILPTVISIPAVEKWAARHIEQPV